MKHLHSSLTRGSASGDAPDATRRREPSAAQVAMMGPETYKRYMQRKGQFADLDRGALAETRRSGFVPAEFIAKRDND
jgi:hypothetical protein